MGETAAAMANGNRQDIIRWSLSWWEASCSALASVSCQKLLLRRSATPRIEAPVRYTRRCGPDCGGTSMADNPGWIEWAAFRRKIPPPHTPMEIFLPAQYGSSPTSTRWPVAYFGIAIALAVAVFVLHGSALDAYWRYDDGAHLSTAARYSPWQYFFLPELVRGVSAGAHITPWNIFFYDVNLSLFGLRPAPFYAHQLLVIWLAAIATFALLRLWIASLPALVGALLFLIGAPTTYVAQQLMTGHYAAGLLFSLCALYAYVVALRAGSWRWAAAATVFYALAVNCKEIYVPLIGVLPFLPDRDWRTRLKFASPLLLVGVAYAGWRVVVLGTLIGGYRPNAATYDLVHVVSGLAKIPQMPFTQSAIGTGALIGVVLALLWALKNRRINIGLLLVSAFLLVAPLAPLTVFPGIFNPDRFLFFIWWAISSLVAALVAQGDSSRRRWALGICALLVFGAAARAHRDAEKALAADTREISTVYRFILGSQPNQVVVPRWSDGDYHWLIDMLMASVEADLDPSGPRRARVMRTEAELSATDPQGLTFWAYDQGCQCVAEVTESVARRFSERQSKLQAGGSAAART
jgi:hypothetical protein